jgi:hypothetical protein
MLLRDSSLRSRLIYQAAVMVGQLGVGLIDLRVIQIRPSNTGTRGLAATHAAGRSGSPWSKDRQRCPPEVPWTSAAAPAPAPGTGTDAIYLATHGWDVTAVDTVRKALAAARRDPAAAGVSPRFVQGDVTRLHELGVGNGYSLLVDFGCFHTLPEDRRPAYVAGVSEAAVAGATLLLYDFKRPPTAAPMHAGVATDEVQQRFSRAGWELASAQRMPRETLGIAVRRAADRFELWRYQLRRVT